MREKTRSIASMCNVPVYSWLYLGDSYVPARQAKKALKTWSRYHKTETRKAGLQAARRLVTDLGNPRAKPAARERLFELIVDMGQRGKWTRKHLDSLLAAVTAVVDPDGDTPLLAGVFPPHVWVQTIANRLSAIRQIDRLSEAQMNAIRFAIHRNLADYSRHRGELLAGSEAQVPGRHFWAQPDLAWAVSNACVYVITWYGLAINTARGQSPSTSK